MIMEQSRVINNKVLKAIVKALTKYPFLFTVFIILSIGITCYVLQNININQYISSTIQWDEDGRVFSLEWYGENCTAVTEPDMAGRVFTVHMTLDVETDNKYIYILDSESKNRLDDSFGDSCNISIMEGKITLFDRIRRYHSDRVRS